MIRLSDEIQKDVDLKVKKTLELAEAFPQISVKVKKFECNIWLEKFRSKDNQELLCRHLLGKNSVHKFQGGGGAKAFSAPTPL